MTYQSTDIMGKERAANNMQPIDLHEWVVLIAEGPISMVSDVVPGEICNNI